MRFAEHRAAAPIVPSGDGGARKPGGNATLMAETVPEAGLPVRNGSPPRPRSGRRTGPGASVRKRLFDIAAASCGLVFLAPLLVTLALLVRLDSRGPALFRQARTGRGGRPFMIYKFRTMAVMEAGHDARQAVPDDPRITGIGRFLRRSSLDELPQLLNVLLGDMSIVGPRPHALAQDAHYGPLVPDYADRFRTRPGVTGLAQVAGFRGPTATTERMAQRVALDNAYIDGWRFSRDISILWRTVKVVILGDHAH
jgi:putative colanic acid biosysnthesis UDP-glucose lipid carrier transferase